ncbi:MAG TPA: nitroreductase family protein [Clostridia bacterium]|nr:nitroreductase family protein [Clostridia bacterium]
MEKGLNFISLIRDRHSIRNYSQYALTDADRTQILETVAGAVPLDSGIHLDWRIGDDAPMGASGLLYAECGTSAEELVEYGYRGEQAVLGLTAEGWGTCWYGMAHMPGSPCSILLGKPGTPGVRTAVLGVLSRGHTRKSLEQLVTSGISAESSPLVRTVLESARLAPSAMNRQTWTFEVASDTRVVIKGGIGRFPDLGICLANAMVTARQLAGSATVTRLDSGEYGVSW